MFYLTIVCVLLSFARGEVRLCSTPLEIVCKEPRPNIEKQLPRNATELRTSCSSTTDYVECLHSYDVACAGRSRDSGISPPLNYIKIRDFLDDACDPSSSLHHLLSRELGCIKRRVMRSDVICAKPNRDVIRAYDKYMKKDPILGERQKGLRLKCLEKVSTAACVLEDIEIECGFSAYEAASNALTSTQLLAYRCNLLIFLELQGILQYLEINDNVKENLRKLFVVGFD